MITLIFSLIMRRPAKPKHLLRHKDANYALSRFPAKIPLFTNTAGYFLFKNNNNISTMKNVLRAHFNNTVIKG